MERSGFPFIWGSLHEKSRRVFKIRCHISIANANSFVSRSLACPTKDFCLTTKHEMTAVVLLIKWRLFWEAQEIKAKKSQNVWNGDTRYRIYRIWGIWIFTHFLTFWQFEFPAFFDILKIWFFVGQEQKRKVRENSNSPNPVVSITLLYNICTLEIGSCTLSHIDFLLFQKLKQICL